MDITITPRKLSGAIDIIPSKSIAHRMLICAAFADGPTEIRLGSLSGDISATIHCLEALGARISHIDGIIHVIPAERIPESAFLPCADSGSTLRFLLPVVGALGVDTFFQLKGRLPQRPLSPLWEEMERMGCTLSRPEEGILHCQGKLRSGKYSITGEISSQFITGLMLGLSLLKETSELDIIGKIESAPYIALTRYVMAQFGLDADRPGGHHIHTPGILTVEGDWSNGAFFLAANALGSSCAVSGLTENSIQGDKAVAAILQDLTKGKLTVEGSDIPDLIPILAVVSAKFHGAEFVQIGRLRLKESDRIHSICRMLSALGIKNDHTVNALTVYPGSFSGGTVDAMNDHRIAMAAAIAATVAEDNITILGADCTEKSYPEFWAEYARLGGIYEKHLR